MGTANIHDRSSIARLYPEDAFAGDAAENDRPKAEVRHGVRITSGPDGAGNFAMERAAQHVGETPDAVFLAPYHRVAAGERAATAPDPREGYAQFLREGYAQFLDAIVEAAQQHGYQAAASPGPGCDPTTGQPGDPRLRGPRQ